MNGYFAKKRLLKGTEKALSVFDTAIDSFSSETAVGKSEFTYDVLLFDKIDCHNPYVKFDESDAVAKFNKKYFVE